MTEIDPYEAPDNVPAEVVAAVEEAAPAYTDLGLQRRFRIMFAMGVAVVLLMGLLLVLSLGGGENDSLRKRNEQLTNTNESQQVLIDKLATQLDSARAQGAAVPTPEVVAAAVPGAEVSPVESVVPGVPGERGDAGLPGVTGSTGDVGLPGSVGEQGSVGPRGLPGVAGADGSPGADGADGAQGPVGPAGTDGAPGANGAPGADGADGAPGGQGPQGPPVHTQDCTPSNVLDLSQPWSCVVTS